MTKYDRHICQVVVNDYLMPGYSYDLMEYEASIRKYSFALYKNEKKANVRHQFYHCPWCGVKFPKSLEVEWENALTQEYGLTLDEVREDKLKIPKELRTDAWWKKRDL